MSVQIDLELLNCKNKHFIISFENLKGSVSSTHVIQSNLVDFLFEILFDILNGSRGRRRGIKRGDREGEEGEEN